MVYFPKNTLNPRKYLFVFTARHTFIGDYSGGDINLRHLSTGQVFDFHFALSSGIIETPPVSHILDIPSGNYEISVISYPNVLYNIKLYMNGIFNSDGSPIFFPETTAILVSVVIMLVLLISSLVLIVHIRKTVINFKSKTDKRKPSKSRIVKNIPSKEDLVRKRIINVTEIMRKSQEIEKQSIINNVTKFPSINCPNCGNTILKQEEWSCAVCGFKPNVK